MTGLAFSFSWVTDSPKKTVMLGKALGERLRGGEVLLFRGGMGSGKTTFTAGLAWGLEVEENVSSPTFTLVNCYPPKAGSTRKLTLWHADLCRLEQCGPLTQDSLDALGYYDNQSAEEVWAVEWSELGDKGDFGSPQQVLTLSISWNEDSPDERHFHLEGAGGGGERFADISL